MEQQLEATAEQAAFSEVWELVCQISVKDGTGPLNKMVEPWHKKVDDRWEFWVNGTTTDLPMTADLPALKRFEMYVTFNGWPAGILDPNSGSLAAGEAANIFAFRDALKAEAVRP